MQSTLTVKTKDGSYPITVARGALARVGSLFNLSRRVLIVTDEGVKDVAKDELGMVDPDTIIYDFD